MLCYNGEKVDLTSLLILISAAVVSFVSVCS